MMSAERQGSSENESDLRKGESLFVDAMDYGDIYFVFIGTSLLLESKLKELSFPFSLSHSIFHTHGLITLSRNAGNLTRTSLHTSTLEKFPRFR